MVLFMNEFLIAILSFIGVVVGTKLTIKLGYKELYTKNVTSNRMEWINVWRNTIPKFIATVDLILNEKR